MIISLKRLKEWGKFILLFVLFTLLVYQVMAFFAHYLQPHTIYEEPSGGAIKVFAPQEEEVAPQSTWNEIENRLLTFYELGE